MDYGHVDRKTGASVDWEAASATVCKSEGHVDRTGL